jgi:hypothetical protein
MSYLSFGALSKSLIWATAPMRGSPARQAACGAGDSRLSF